MDEMVLALFTIISLPSTSEKSAFQGQINIKLPGGEFPALQQAFQSVAVTEKRATGPDWEEINLG